LHFYKALMQHCIGILHFYNIQMLRCIEVCQFFIDPPVSTVGFIFCNKTKLK
jgi:hypothetical protein